MQFDLSILEKYISGFYPPTLRFYLWNPVSLSIGRNQKIKDINLIECKNRNIEITKRPTGGKAVLHQGEITYSFVAGKKDGFSDSIFDSYIEISKAIIKGLENLTKNKLFSIGDKPSNDYKFKSFCFSSSTVSDINYLGKKVVGSAQYRKGENFLQHGSILINQDFNILSSLFNNSIDTNELINLSEILGYIPQREKVIECLIEAFESFFSVDFKDI